MIVISNSKITLNQEDEKIKESLNNLLIGFINVVHRNDLTSKESLQKEYSTLYNLISEGKYDPSYIIPAFDYLLRSVCRGVQDKSRYYNCCQKDRISRKDISKKINKRQAPEAIL